MGPSSFIKGEWIRLLELLVNIILLLFFIFTLLFHVTEAAIPIKVLNNPNTLKPNVWPSVILVLLILCIVANIIKIIRNNKGKPDFSLKAFGATIPGFLRSKMFIGIAIVVVLSFLLEPLGFMPTCFLFLMGYGVLLGNRKYLKLALFSLLIMFVLYIGFGVFLQVNLPRGTIPFLRSFSLFVESLIP